MPAPAAKANLSGEGLTISPPIFELAINPGQISDQSLKLNNPTDSLVEMYPTVANFGADADETGKPTFSPSTDESNRYALANWIKFNSSKVALTPQQEITFDFQITVPSNAEPGGHYGVLFFNSTPPKVGQDVSQVALAESIGALILVKVPGDVKEEGYVKEFSTDKLFYLKSPVKYLTRIGNSGNVHFKPKGDIVIKNMFHRRVGEVAVNAENGNVLPNSIRRFETNWSTNWRSFGRFTAELGLVYGSNNKPLTGQLVFYIIPWWLIIILALILIVIIYLIIRYSKKRKKRKLENRRTQRVILR